MNEYVLVFNIRLRFKTLKHDNQNVTHDVTHVGWFFFRVLYEFKGNIQLNNEETFPLSNDAILLRGSRLKSTQWIIGLVVFTGHETKLMMNSTKAPLKRSRMDILTNYQVNFQLLRVLEKTEWFRLK